MFDRAMTVYLKNATMLFFRLNANRYCLELSNELPFIVLGQEDAKLWFKHNHSERVQESFKKFKEYHPERVKDYQKKNWKKKSTLK